MTNQAQRFSVKTVVALILVGVFSLSALAVLSAYAPDLRTGDDGGAQPLSRSAVGFAGLVRLLGDSGQPVLLSRGPLHANSSEGLLILTPGPQHGSTALEAVHHDGAVLVVLPKWGTQPLPGKPAWVKAVGLYDERIVARPVARLGMDSEEVEAEDRDQPNSGGKGGHQVEAPATVISRRAAGGHPRLKRPDGTPFGGDLGEIDRLQTISGPNWVPVIVDETGAAVVAMDGVTGAYVLADPDLLNTQGLKAPARAVAATHLLRLIWTGGGPVIFDLTLHGFQRPRSVMRLMLESPLLGATLALLAAAALIAYQAFVRFGPGRRQGRAIALGKRALADNSAGLVRLARREHRMAGPYAQLVRASVARAIGAPRNLDGEALDSFLDRLGGKLGSHDQYTVLAAEARDARTPGDLIAVARKLHRWRLEMTRGRQ
jgi:hypothetical protein